MVRVPVIGVDVDVVGFESSFEMFTEMVGELRGEEAGGWTAAELEARLETQGRELVRRLFQDHVDLRAVREERVEGVADDMGMPRGTVETAHRRPLATVFGEVTVERFAYRRRGYPNLYPADGALNLPAEKYSHGLRRLAAIESTRGSFDDTIDAICRATGVRLGKHQSEDLAERAAVDFDAFYASRTPPEAGEGDVLVLSMDGKGIVMRPEALRAATAAAAGRPSPASGVLSNDERRHRKRMAEVGAVFDITPAVRSPTDIMAPADERARGPKVHGKWLTASVTEDTATVISEVFAEADRRDPNRTRRWIALVDGNNHQLDRIRIEADQRAITVTVVVDFVHVLEYLWRAVRCFHPDTDPAARIWVHERAQKILEGHAPKVATNIRRRAARGH
jgi:hypothetical protein